MEQVFLFLIILAVLVASMIIGVKLFQKARWMLWIPSIITFIITVGLFITALRLDSWAALGYLIFAMLAFGVWLILVIFNTIYSIKNKRPIPHEHTPKDDLSKHL